jgi:hypothetical protein
MNEEYFKNFVKQSIADRPDLKDEIEEYVQLAYDEIDSGKSQWHEFELAYSDIKDLMADDTVSNE